MKPTGKGGSLATDDVGKGSREDFKAIIEAIPQFVWRTTPDGEADYASDRLCRYLGLPAEKIIGWQWLDLIHPEDRQRVETAWAQARKAQQPISIDFRVQRQGSVSDYRWVRSLGNPFFDSSGKLDKYFGTWTDIHDQRAVHEDLSEVLESMSDGFLLIGPNWEILRVNNCHVEISQTSREEQIGKNFLSVFFATPEERRLPFVKHF